jgi:hypothetical protein
MVSGMPSAVATHIMPLQLAKMERWSALLVSRRDKCFSKGAVVFMVVSNGPCMNGASRRGPLRIVRQPETIAVRGLNCNSKKFLIS